MDKIYAFKYNFCIYESSDSVISLHRTKKGAYKAMKKFLFDNYADWRNRGKWRHKFGWSERWYIEEIKVED